MAAKVACKPIGCFYDGKKKGAVAFWGSPAAASPWPSFLRLALPGGASLALLGVVQVTTGGHRFRRRCGSAGKTGTRNRKKKKKKQQPHHHVLTSRSPFTSTSSFSPFEYIKMAKDKGKGKGKSKGSKSKVGPRVGLCHSGAVAES